MKAFRRGLKSIAGKRGHDVLDHRRRGFPEDTHPADWARLDWSIRRVLDGVILELGANDALARAAAGKNPAKIWKP